MKNLRILLILLTAAGSAQAMQKGGTAAPFTSPDERSQSERDLFESKAQQNTESNNGHHRELSRLGKAVIAYKKRDVAHTVVALAKAAEKAQQEIDAEKEHLAAVKKEADLQKQQIAKVYAAGKIPRKESEDLEHAVDGNLIKATAHTQAHIHELTYARVAKKIVIADLAQAAENPEFQIPSVRTHKVLDGKHVFDKVNPNKISPAAKEALQDEELHTAMRSYLAGNEQALTDYAGTHAVE